MDKTAVYTVTLFFIIIMAITGSIWWYNSIDQGAYLERKSSCAQAGGVYIESPQIQGCVKISPVGK